MCFKTLQMVAVLAAILEFGFHENYRASAKCV